MIVYKYVCDSTLEQYGNLNMVAAPLTLGGT